MAERLPTTDLDLNEASSAAQHAAHAGSAKDFGGGLVCVLLKADGVVPQGGLVALTGALDGDAEAATDTILAALSASDRKAVAIYVAQGPAAGMADGEYFWAVKKKLDGADTRAVLLAAAAITAAAQVATTDTNAGEVDDLAATGSYDIEGLSVITDPAGNVTFTAWKTGEFMQLDPTANA